MLPGNLVEITEPLSFWVVPVDLYLKYIESLDEFNLYGQYISIGGDEYYEDKIGIIIECITEKYKLILIGDEKTIVPIDRLIKKP